MKQLLANCNKTIRKYLLIYKSRFIDSEIHCKARKCKNGKGFKDLWGRTQRTRRCCNIQELKKGYRNIIGSTHKELDSIDQSTVRKFFEEEKPEFKISGAN